MNRSRRVEIRKLSTGVPGLDEVLGGGLPEYSFSVIAGGPGSGKTTLAQQIVFSLASAERPTLYFSVLGEPPLKMLRYQQQFRFFDIDKVGGDVRFISLGAEFLGAQLEPLLETIVAEVERVNPGIVVIDSFRAAARAATSARPGIMEMQEFVQRLALHLASWEATTFLVGEYGPDDLQENPVFTVADGILWLVQSAERSAVVRRLQVVKMRGQASMPGLHTFRITGDGIEVFPRLSSVPQVREAQPRPRVRISIGVPGLDEMLGGGIPTGDAVLLAGPAGTGKTLTAMQFIVEGARRGEPGVIVVFEERPAEYLARAAAFGFDMEAMIERGELRILYLRPLDLSVDETLREIRVLTRAVAARRLVVDSLSGFEVALAPPFREDFRESLYRMVGMLTGEGITVLMTVEVVESFTDLRFSPHEISFLTDDIILQRYVELEGQLRRVLTVVKMRSSQHSKDLRLYEITDEGVAMGPPLSGYQGVLTGVPGRLQRIDEPLYRGLTDAEITVLQRLTAQGEATFDTLLRQTGLRPQAMTRALARLVALNHAIELEDAGQTVYRPVARPLTP